jgi:predicted DNA binding protein
MTFGATSQPLHKRPALTGKQVRRLREAFDAGVQRKALGKRFGISMETMRRYLRLPPINRKTPK